MIKTVYKTKDEWWKRIPQANGGGLYQKNVHMAFLIADSEGETVLDLDKRANYVQAYFEKCRRSKSAEGLKKEEIELVNMEDTKTVLEVATWLCELRIKSID